MVCDKDLAMTDEKTPRSNRTKENVPRYDWLEVGHATIFHTGI